MQGLLRLFLCFLCFPYLANATMEETINQLCNRSRESKSDAVLITHRGKVIFEYHSKCEPQPLDLLSLTPSIASLAIGILEDEGKICIDQPICDYYPEWNQGMKKQITLRHLLTNTSGLQSGLCNEELYQSKNIIQIALCAGTSDCPGSSFFPNPKALNLLSGIVQKITGMNLGEFLELKLFAPLGIENVSWLCDGLGTTFFHSHLSLTAPDLAKIGEMLTNGGCYQGKQLISKQWIDKMTRPSQIFDLFFGFQWGLNFFSASCWWQETLLKQYQSCGVNPDFVKRLELLDGRVIEMPGILTKTEGCRHFNQQVIDILGGPENTEKFCNEVEKCHLPTAYWKVDGLMSYEGISESGQQLIILPEMKVVAVRLVCQHGCCDSLDKFSDFGALVSKLTYSMER